MDVHDTSWTLNAAYVWGLPPGMAPAFAILASNDAAAKVASKNSAAAGVQLFQPLGYHILACHTAIYTRIYTGPLFWSFLLPESGKLSFLKAGVYLESKSKTMKSRWDIRISILHCTTIYRTTILMNAYTSYSISGSPFINFASAHQGCSPPHRPY